MQRYVCRRLAYVVEFLLQREPVQAGQGQTKEQADSAIEHEEGIAIGAFHVCGTALNCSRVRNAPMSRDRLARPHGAYFVRGVIADRNYEVELWRIRRGEFLPRLAASSWVENVHRFQLAQCFGTTTPLGWLPALYAVKLACL